MEIQQNSYFIGKFIFSIISFNVSYNVYIHVIQTGTVDSKKGW